MENINDWYIEIGKGYYNRLKNKKELTRNMFVQKKNFNEMIKGLGDKEIYTTVLCYKDKNQDKSLKYGDLYLDFDTDLTKENFNDIKKDLLLAINTLEIKYKIPKEYLNIYFSGNKGFHIIIPATVFDLQPCIELNEIYKYIAKDINEYTINKTIDTRIYDSKRLFRLSNTLNIHDYNSNENYYKIPITLNELMNIEYHELLNLAKSPREIQSTIPKTIPKSALYFNYIKNKYSQELKEQFKVKNITKKPLKNIPICIKYIVKNGISLGKRNNTLCVIASSLMQVGFDDNEVFTVATMFSDNCNIKIKNSEITKTIKSIRRMYNEQKFYGCTAIKDLDLCIESCPLNKKKEIGKNGRKQSNRYTKKYRYTNKYRKPIKDTRTYQRERSRTR